MIKDQYGRPMLDATGKTRLDERDHWFTLQFKLLWKTGAPQGGSSGAAAASTGAATAGQTPTTAPSRKK